MVYSKRLVRDVLDAIGVDVVSETSTDVLCLCPKHSNSRTPAFAISKSTGLFKCFNGSCNYEGNLERLVRDVTGRNRPEALRFISKKMVNDGPTLAEQLDEIFSQKEEWRIFPQQVVSSMVGEFWESEDARGYMHSRGIFDEALRYFEVGYSPKKDLVAFPVHNPPGDTCVGVVGRSIKEKRFDNSKQLPRNRILFNLHRARKQGDSVVVVESGFDAMRVHQAGYPCVVAMLGSAVSSEHISLLERNFVEVIIFTDNDPAGMKMRDTLADNLSLSVLHAASDYDTLYPGEDTKDAGDLTDTQIQLMIDNAITTVEYDMTIKGKGE